MSDSARSIPACAGEPRTRFITTTRGWVYPRVCGGTACWPLPTCRRPGLSPRVRGNPRLRLLSRRHPGSIPACAGEPPFDTLAERRMMVYPRVCGGTGAQTGDAGSVHGLSPRVRGNPSAARPPPADRGVYPRVCGGTIQSPAKSSRAEGLSPRVRGNLSVHSHTVRAAGSIPACAGEPHPLRRSALRYPVYPRVCGGTVDYARKS